MMVNIVNQNEILSHESTLIENYNIIALLKEIKETDSSIRWLVRRNLLRNFLRCDRLE